MSQTWQKACDCKDATATSGRTVLRRGQPQRHEMSFGALLSTWETTTYHRGPVCDSCDTPWILTESTGRLHDSAGPPLDF